MKNLLLSQAIHDKLLGRSNWFAPIEAQIRANPKLKEIVLRKAKELRATCIIEKLSE